MDQELEAILKKQFLNTATGMKFLARLHEGSLTRDENPESHICAYFAAIDPGAKQVFIGHHKKSGLWLFNGGHIDQGEGLQQALIREIGEEWGLAGEDFAIGSPELLTITDIYNPTKQPCRTHYDLWYFLEVDKAEFLPLEANLLEEFHEKGWKNLEEARILMKDENSLLAIDFIENNYF